MSWKSTKKYESLLQINNAILKEHTREGLFRAIATELKKLFHYDRCSINLYDPDTKSLSYFATAEGIKPEGITCTTSRPLPSGSVANLVIESRRPVIIKDLLQHPELTTADTMLRRGLVSTMAFPLIIRDDFLGSFHVAFKKCPTNVDEITSFLEDLSSQITIAIDNMMSYYKLRKINERLEKQKQYVLEKVDNQDKDFFFTSRVMGKLMNDVDLIANSDTAVLISGETGTGKDHIARHIHNLSSRRKQLFVKVNCAALVPTLIESELFGHAKGSFTGASARRTGRFEMADGGSIFLDEVGELPMKSQAKLLQVLEEKTFERVGESTPVSVDFRIISATNQDLKVKIRDMAFRRDLYYRLNTIHIEIPPLRDRVDDIALLVRSFTTRFAEKWQKPEARYSSSAMDALCRYPWPGNVRELQNVVERIMILRGGHTINESDIHHLLHSFESEEQESGKEGFPTREEMEKRHIEKALEHCGGVIGGRHGAARLLGIPRTTLQYRMKKLGVVPGAFSGAGAASEAANDSLRNEYA
ncbi:MAG: sigma-54-dependent Fis family transcriptional regulator [Deltaproteobacteria bacterium]|nr:sigma-54-dependent Fis family transcriptional regulator [Deltaproteobacteria bacterium]